MTNFFNHAEYTNINSEMDGYHFFEAAVKARFQNLVESGQKLFTTNATGFYDTYLANLPAHSQQHYSCNACRHFFDRYGNLVVINNEGQMESALWSGTGIGIPNFFAPAVASMNKLVMDSKVDGVFLSEVKTLGQPKTGEWTHPHAILPAQMVFRSRLQTASQAMAEKRQDFEMLTRALVEHPIETVEQALTLIKSETMYRSDRVLGVAEWFKKVIVARNSAPTSDKKRNIVWLAVSEAPTGFTHIKSSMIGTLLEDISGGLSPTVSAARFAEKMNPANYQRSQSAPSSNAIFEAEKVVEKLGIADSLQRRYASFEEVPKFWTPKVKKDVFSSKPAGVFGHLQAKSQIETRLMALPSSVMTWDKFQRTLLQTASEIEVLVDNPNRLMALVTAANNESENILQWDNPFSWYYHGGVDAEMKQRVESSGGRYEDNEIRVSLLWDGYTDLDLHCITPLGQEIMFNNKRGRCGGFLDLDMNGLDKQSQTPVENMRWENNAPQGRYNFMVNNYSEKVNYRSGTPFKVELEINGNVYHYEGKPLGNKEKVTVFEFDYVRGQQPVISDNVSSNSDWSVSAGNFVKVNGITTSPNLWGIKPAMHAGTHIFFLLDEVKDLSEGKGRGFFNEMLKPELKAIRKTLELFTASTPISNSDEASACGVGFSKDNEWNLTVKVTSGNYTQLVKIDRWD